MRFIFTLALLLPAVLALPAVQIRESFVTMPIAARINATGIRNVLEADRARARSLAQMAQVQNGTLSADAVINVPVTNRAVDYTASVGIGTPPTQYTLIVDTGSSNTWVGADQEFVETSSTVFANQGVSMTYGGGRSFSGLEFTDTVTLASGLVIAGQGIGVADQVIGITGVDGILGLGPTGLTKGTLSPDTEGTIPTVVDSLFAQGTISANLIGISFEPITSNPVTNGQITFGGTDSSKFTGSITFTPITSTAPAKNFWGIDQSITYGDTDILSGASGIVDTGVTLIMVSPDAFETYLKQTGGEFDAANTGLIRLTTSEFEKLQDLNFVIGGTTFALTPNAQAWPRSLNAMIGGNDEDVYLIVANIGTGASFDFINGYTFLERFYSVYDTTNQRVGFATTPFTDATTN